MGPKRLSSGDFQPEVWEELTALLISEDLGRAATHTRKHTHMHTHVCIHRGSDSGGGSNNGVWRPLARRRLQMAPFGQSLHGRL